MSEKLSQDEPAMYRVRFGEDGQSVEVPAGTTLLQAAREADIFVDSICAGDGVCGKCRVLVREGEVSGETSDFLSIEEIRKGYVLACKTRVKSDLLVEVPPESRLHKQVPEQGRPRKRLRELSLRERKPVSLNPLVRKIHVQVPPATLDDNSADLERLGRVLAPALGEQSECQMGLKVTGMLPENLRRKNGSVTATTGYRGNLTEIIYTEPGDTSASNLALVVDIGTTTVVAHLVDPATGQTLDSALKYNTQAAYGADVIRRIIWCDDNPGGLAQLQDIVAADINSLTEELSRKLHISTQDINVAVVAGNTTMLHLALGLTPRWIRREPYSGVTNQPPPFRAAEIGLKINPRGLLYCLPCNSAFVGGDIVAGVMATGLDESDRLRMLIDIGTNGEIVVGNRDWLMCASASAGPAFEGAGNRDGMRAMAGAIDHVRNVGAGRALNYSTVGNKPPVGMCGTAYVDLLAELVRAEVLDRTGNFNKSIQCDRVRERNDGTLEYVVVAAGESEAERDLVLTQDDVSNLLRAKAAIYSAARILLSSLGLGFADLDELLVAGAFGNYLDQENAVCIGLLPDLPAEKMRFAGNTSIIGAKMAALSTERFRHSREIADKMTYFELSTDPHFMNEFTSACFFPHTNIEEFPSVVRAMK